MEHPEEPNNINNDNNEISTSLTSSNYQETASNNNNLTNAEVYAQQTPNIDNKDSCPSCGNMEKPAFPHSYVYALGSVRHRYPSLSIENEFAQSVEDLSQTDPNETRGKTETEVLSAIISRPKYRHILRKLCWVLRIEGLDTYILTPSNPADYDMIVDAVRRTPSPSDVDVVIGVRGPVAPPIMCGGLSVPIVAFHQIYASNIEEFIDSITGRGADKAESGKSKRGEEKSTKSDKTPEGTREREGGLADTVTDVLRRIMQMADNVGSADEHRALNYLAVRSRDIYRLTRDMYNQNYSFTAIQSRMSRLSSTRKIVDIIFTYTHRESRYVDKWFVRVDVTEEFPFIHTTLGRYFER